ncbi:tetratricopeptide repeat-containing sensor histidine kinase [Runella aurantiaca]|uniref:Uncharacterized protein n=1 Tax=Runella aurantiaca TaxID=2282308 RepID=A0A369IHY3_9BACT|nr:histidine kinase [Runella aurantiaca]RDB06874.1 hypothetical protein DVG78_06200 [Runella aurantiaca]
MRAFTKRSVVLSIIILFSVVTYGQYFRVSYSVDSLKKVLLAVESKSAPTQKKEILTLNTLIATAFNKDAQFDSSLSLLRKILPELQAQNMLNEIAEAHFHIGWALQKRELYFEAVKSFEEAIVAAQKAKNDSLLAISHHWAGISYSDQKVYPKSLWHYKKELEICKKAKLKFQHADCLNSIGLHYFGFEKIDSAFYFFDVCRKISEKNQFDILLPISYKNVGKCYWALGNEQKGTDFIYRSIELFLNHKNPRIRYLSMYSYIELARYYANKKNYNLSNQNALKGLKINALANFTDLQQDFSFLLYKNHKATKQTLEALQYLEIYQKASEKINQNYLAQQHAALDERVQNEQQKNQIYVLNQEKIAKQRERNWLIGGLTVAGMFLFVIGKLYQTNRKQKKVIQKANEQLEEKVKLRTAELQRALDEIKQAMLKGQKLERTRVAAELHDNLGSLLSAISISMEVVEIGELSLHEQQIFAGIQQQINAAYHHVRLLAHNLQPAELEREGLKKALEIFAAKINQSKYFHLTLDTTALVPLSKDLEFTLYSICLELINNTLKHAQATQVRIAFDQQTAHRWQMIVADNGKGMMPNTKEGFGIQNIRNRLEQIGATLHIIQEKGLTFLIDFKTDE